MSVRQAQLQFGEIHGGYSMGKVEWWVHGLGLLVMSMVMTFSYAVLMLNGPAPAFVGFAFGFGFLLLIYGHHLDQFYLHIGDKVKLGGESYDPRRKFEDQDEREKWR